MKCDNYSQAHIPRILYDSNEAMVAICTLCWAQETFRKDSEGRMNMKSYIDFFKRDTLQVGHPLYYKYRSDTMNVV